MLYECQEGRVIRIQISTYTLCIPMYPRVENCTFQDKENNIDSLVLMVGEESACNVATWFDLTERSLSKGIFRRLPL